VGHQVIPFSHDISSLFFGLEFYAGSTVRSRTDALFNRQGKREAGTSMLSNINLCPR